MQRLLADNAAAGMLGMARALNGLTGVIDPRDVVGVRGTGAVARRRLDAGVCQRRARPLRGRDDLAVLDRERLAERRGGDHVLRRDRHPLAAFGRRWLIPHRYLFLQGSALRAVLAAIVVFGLLPQVTTFPTLCLTLGLVPVPLGFLNRSGVEADVHLRGRRQFPAACSTSQTA